MSDPDGEQHSGKIDALVDEFVRRLRGGEPVAAEDLVDAHPDISEELAARLAAAEALLDRSPPLSSAASSPSSPSIPGYRIGAEVHRGGQGVVYRAVQEGTRRDVAIKVLYGGAFAGPRDRARFEREVLILSRLSHPNIVTVHDGGSAPGGFYFVMDYIRGKPLDQFVREADLKPRPIMKLMAKVCEAVDVAHLRGVIHRDLKPGNIRVDPAGEPHVLDFGLAKVGEFDELADARTEIRTVAGEFVGSVSWASPEQAEGRPEKVDIRSDVYSLGVILFQILTGRFPYDVTGSLRNVLDRIARADPVEPKAIRSEIDPETSAIVLRCLAKDPERRYQSAGDLARDIRRYLAGEAIEAKRDSSWYVMRKSLRRHRAHAAVAAAFVVVITVGFVLSATFWAQAARARDEAENERREAVRQAKIAAAVNDFLNHDLLALADPMNTPDREITVKEVLDTASERIEGRFSDEPLVEASIHTTLGHTYLNLGKLQEAEPHLKRALDLRRAELGEPNERTLQSVNNLASLYHEQGRYEDAESLFQKVIRIRTDTLGEDHPQTLTAVNNIALLYESQGRYDEAEALHLRTLEARRRALGDEDPKTLSSMNNLALLYMKRGRLDEARPLLVETLKIRRRLLGKENPKTLTSMNNLASLHYHQGRYAEAEKLYAETLRIGRRVLGEDHPNTLRSMNNLGGLYAEHGRPAAAVPLLVGAVQGRRRVLGPEHPDTLRSMNNLATTYESLERFEEAERLLVEGLEISRRVLGEEHPDTLMATNNLAVLYKTRSRHEEAEPLYVKVLDARRRLLGENHPRTLVSMSNLGSLYIQLGRYEEAEPLFASAVERVGRSLPPGHWYGGAFLLKYGICLTHLGRHGDAEDALLEAHGILAKALGPKDPRTTAVREALVDLYERWGKPQMASDWRGTPPVTSQPAG